MMFDVDATHKRPSQVTDQPLVKKAQKLFAHISREQNDLIETTHIKNIQQIVILPNAIPRKILRGERASKIQEIALGPYMISGK